MNQYRILLLGARGQLGRALAPLLAGLGEVHAPDRRTCDLADPESLRPVMRRIAPDLIVNAAAFTDVEAAQNTREHAFTVNAVAPGVLAEEADRLGAVMVQYSTDYVFAGGGDTPWREADEPAPLNVYGESKLAGETAVMAACARHLVLRTSWLYDTVADNFLTRMRAALTTRDCVPVVTDQVGAPTWVNDLARASLVCIRAVLAEEGRGLAGRYHLAQSGAVSRYDFAQALRAHLAAHGHRPLAHIVPATLDSLPAAVARPRNCRLDCSRAAATFGVRLPEWQLALDAACAGGLAS